MPDSSSSATTGTTSAKDGSGDQSLSGFRRIYLSGLRVDTVTDFALYLRTRPGEVPVLFRERNLPFTEEVRQRLLDSKVDRLFIRSGQEDAYALYIERNLDYILKSPDVPTDEKAGMLYFSVQRLMAQVMTDARSGPLIQRSKHVVESTVDFMLTEKAAFEHLLEVVSYDYYTYTHSVNVFVFSLALAQRTWINEPARLRAFGDGVLLHDVGKSRIDPSIVNCRGKLTPEQWEIMKHHPVYGYEILTANRTIGPVGLDVVRHHHEKLRGAGYPDGLKGDQISRAVRICTIADVFDALTTRRTYKSALHSFPALKLMQDEMAKDLDPDLFRAFVELMGNPAG